MFPIIDVVGSGHERGRQYGLAARVQVGRSLANYAQLFEACGIPWTDLRRRSRAYDELISAFDAGLHDELRGIAAGAGCEIDDILALNSRTELLPLTFFEPQGSVLRETTEYGECSSLAVPPASSASGGTLLAQNWDWLGSQREALVVVRARRPDGSAFVTLTEAGMLAKIGCNDRGFGICLNVLRSLDDGAVPGVPVHVLLRALLDCESVAHALTRIRGLRFAASSNVLCADAGGRQASIEVSPGGFEVLESDGVLCHTNHFLAPLAAEVRAMAPPPSSRPRLSRLQSLTGDRSQRLSVADVQRILSDESAGYLSISRHPDPALPQLARFETVASVVMELASATLHIAPDIPTRTPFRKVSLRD
jgi:isopenicillin-N N-acyltransferase-like protein